MDIKGSQLSIGDRIEVRGLESRKKIKFTSQILDIMDEKTFIIGGPILRSHIVPIRLNSIFEITYIKEEKGRFLFRAIVIDREYKGVYKLKIEKVSDTFKFQERDFYRLPINLNVIKTLTIFDGIEEKEIEEKCVTKDISGGGMRLLCNYKHNIEDIVNIKLSINQTEVSYDGEVVRILKSESYGYIYEIGIKFTNLKNADRDTLVRFIYEQQRINRRKERM